MPRKRQPARGDRVEICWIDICEDAIGNPDEARCIVRVTLAYFWERRIVDYSGLKAELVITCSTIDEDSHVQQGWTAYPSGAILGMRILKGQS